ncbi:PH domain-containing protein [Alkalihalobacillus oceani]|uniref:PH domain-containing protein n=1 Tax=Halalkalibacter oceani TaxID=1653776 RepID=A0A9X2DQH4_9BACI|nr:PH domain-containing protein [Halalkalibacter oceani]MCM3715194.1 PH domain-containing protein [Halalkalibacter oceani]
MNFKSRRDTVTTVTIWLTASLMIIPFFTRELISFFILAPICTLLLWCWFQTDYTLKHDEIRIRCGPFRKRIQIAEIRRIEATSSLVTTFSLGLSLKRIIIHYGAGYSLVEISPQQQDEFIKAVTAINPHIELSGLADPKPR